MKAGMFTLTLLNLQLITDIIDSMAKKLDLATSPKLNSLVMKLLTILMTQRYAQPVLLFKMLLFRTSVKLLTQAQKLIYLNLSHQDTVM